MNEAESGTELGRNWEFEYSVIKKRLKNLLQNVQLSYVKDGPSFLENCREINERWKEAKAIYEILRDLRAEVAYPNKRLESMNRMLVYLGLVESVGDTLMDIFIMVLIMNGKEIHTRGPDIKHVRLMKELRDTTFDSKLNFLKDEGFSFFKTFVDKNTRNIIAHLKFTIEDNGDVKEKDRKRSPINIRQKINEFLVGVHLVEAIFNDIEFFRSFKISPRDNL